jgi:hypothetical protein
MKKNIYPILSIIILLWASPLTAKDFHFPEMPGWKPSGEIQTFQPENLFDYINGAADLYLSYEFQELKVAEYQNEKKASVIIEIYKHKNPTLAFGIYSQERLGNSTFLDIGSQGYNEKDILNFITGSYYVKINSYKTGPEEQEILINFAKKVSEHLGKKGTLPSILSLFPGEGKKRNSEKFTYKNYLGYAFLHSAFTAEYELPGTTFKLFIIEGADKGECRDMIQRYLQQVRSPEKNITEGRYTLSDPYHGELELSWKEKYIGGILNLNDPSLRLKYLKLFEERLQRRK